MFIDWTSLQRLINLWTQEFWEVQHPLTLYDLGERISSVWPKFRLKKKKGSLKKIPMSAASMSR